MFVLLRVIYLGMSLQISTQCKKISNSDVKHRAGLLRFIGGDEYTKYKGWLMFQSVVAGRQGSEVPCLWTRNMIKRR